MENPPEKFVEVYRAKNGAQAHLIRQTMEQAGIRVMLENDMLQGAVGELPFGWVTAPRILVEESQVALAGEIIARFEAAELSSPAPDAISDESRCLSCGAAMTESQAACPQCGWSYQ